MICILLMLFNGNKCILRRSKAIRLQNAKRHAAFSKCISDHRSERDLSQWEDSGEMGGLGGNNREKMACVSPDAGLWQRHCVQGHTDQANRHTMVHWNYWQSGKNSMMGSNSFRIPRSRHYLFKLSVNRIDGEEKKQEKKKREKNPSKRIDAPCHHLIISLLDRCPSSVFSLNGLSHTTQRPRALNILLHFVGI